MDTVIVQLFVGCLLIGWKIGLAQNSYCQDRLKHVENPHVVKVCQDNNGSLVNHTDVIIIDAAGAHPHQNDIDCKCYISSINGGSKQYVSAFIFFDIDGNQNVEFKVSRHTYNTNSPANASVTFPPAAVRYLDIGGFLRRRSIGDKNGKIGMGRGRLTVRCLKQQTTSTISTNDDNESSTDDLTALLCAIIGGGILLSVIGIFVCCVVKRNRRSTRHISKNPEANSKIVRKAREPTDLSAESKKDNAAASRRKNDKHEADKRDVKNGYVYIEHCVHVDTASTCICTTFNSKDSKLSSESDLYNHLNEVQPGPHSSDNVYSTTHVCNTTKQKLGALLQYRSTVNQYESDIYNHLNEVGHIPHSDNIYNTLDVHRTAHQDPGATASQYDSVELVNYPLHAQPDSDYNVLSFL